MCEVNAKMFHADICVQFRACMMIGTETGFAVSAHIRIILHSLARLVSELIFATFLTGQMTKKLIFFGSHSFSFSIISFLTRMRKRFGKHKSLANSAILSLFLCSSIHSFIPPFPFSIFNQTPYNTYNIERENK